MGRQIFKMPLLDIQGVKTPKQMACPGDVWAILYMLTSSTQVILLTFRESSSYFTRGRWPGGGRPYTTNKVDDGQRSGEWYKSESRWSSELKAVSWS